MPNETEAAIRKLIETRTSAVNEADPEKMVALLDNDVSVFDMIGELRTTGNVMAQEAAEKWLDLYDDGPHWENREILVTSHGDVAVAHMLSHVAGHRKDGVDVDMWFRPTPGLRYTQNAWHIFHEHQSVPFDIENNKASLGLKP